MPWFEDQPCTFQVFYNGHGAPSGIHIEFKTSNPSLLSEKAIGSIFFGLREGTTHAEAEVTRDAMRFGIRALRIRHLAAGER